VQPYSDEERRHLVVARLPDVTTLNGSRISADNRLESERFFIRHFLQKDDKPQRFVASLSFVYISVHIPTYSWKLCGQKPGRGLLSIAAYKSIRYGLCCLMRPSHIYIYIALGTVVFCPVWSPSFRLYLTCVMSRKIEENLSYITGFCARGFKLQCKF
jgi:hypothetical protein